MPVVRWRAEQTEIYEMKINSDDIVSVQKFYKYSKETTTGRTQSEQ